MEVRIESLCVTEIDLWYFKKSVRRGITGKDFKSL